MFHGDIIKHMITFQYGDVNHEFQMDESWRTFILVVTKHEGREAHQTLFRKTLLERDGVNTGGYKRRKVIFLFLSLSPCIPTSPLRTGQSNLNIGKFLSPPSNPCARGGESFLL